MRSHEQKRNPFITKGSLGNLSIRKRHLFPKRHLPFGAGWNPVNQTPRQPEICHRQAVFSCCTESLNPCSESYAAAKPHSGLEEGMPFPALAGFGCFNAVIHPNPPYGPGRIRFSTRNCTRARLTKPGSSHWGRCPESGATRNELPGMVVCRVCPTERGKI